MAHVYHQAPARVEKLKARSKTIYWLYVFGAVVGFTALVGVIMVYLNRHHSGQDWLESHFRFQLQTFWYGLIIFLVSLILMPILIGMAIWLYWIYWVIKRSFNGLNALEAEVAIQGSFWDFGKVVEF